MGPERRRRGRRFGVAGAAAAIAAADAGRRPLVLEATAAGGGNAVYSGGFLFDVGAADVGVDYLDALCFGRTPRPVLTAYADGLHGLRDWLHTLGAASFDFPDPPGKVPAEFPAWPHFPGGRATRRYMVQGAGGRPGPALWATLEAACAARDVEVRTGARVRELVLGDGGEVLGVVVEEDGRRTAVQAAGGVVLACGGFEADPELADAHLPLAAIALCHPANRGDGLGMGRQAGASEWHLYGCFGWFSYVAEGFDAPFGLDVFATGFVLVDADGRRFADETGHEAHDRLRSLLTHLPPAPPPEPAGAAELADLRRGHAAGRPAQRHAGHAQRLHLESGQQRRDRARLDRARRDGRAARRRDGRRPRRADRDARRLRAGDRRGRGPDLRSRPRDADAPARPGACDPVMPAIAGTVGGPRHDERGRVLRPDRTPVPGLYAAGAVSLVFGHLIDFGGGLTDGMVFGRLAGQAAAARAAERDLNAS